MKKKHRQANITLRWIPSHMEIKGNEEADRQAKKAAEGNTDSPTHRLPKVLRRRLPDSKSAIKQNLSKHLKIEAVTILHKSPQWTKLVGIDPSRVMPSARYHETVEWLLPHKHASLLIQLRTGHAPLNKHLYTITPLSVQHAKTPLKQCTTS